MPSKVTAEVREAILKAFDLAGGVEYLCAVAREDPKAFCALLGKPIPVKVGGDEDNPPVFRMTIHAPPNESREQWLARTARERGLSPPVVGASQTDGIMARWGHRPGEWDGARVAGAAVSQVLPPPLMPSRLPSRKNPPRSTSFAG